MEEKKYESMEVRYGGNARDVKHYTTDQLREEFLVQDLFIPGRIRRVYSHIDRIIVMGFCPTDQAQDLGQDLDIWKSLGVDYFLERRELGVINVGGPGRIEVDGKTYTMKPEDGIYIGKETKEVKFYSQDPQNPAKYYSLSTPAHAKYPDMHVDVNKAKKVPMGSQEEGNKRVIYQFIHPEVMETCQLVMGLTKLDRGNVWNTMPAHTHDRRMEVYFYFNLSQDKVVFHLFGEPQETRHIVVRQDEAIISPSWSLHSGCGTSNYSFIWGMCGENKTFTDMDHIAMQDLR